MLDKKKLIALIAAAVVGLALIIALLVWLIGNIGSDKQAVPAPSASSPSAAPSALTPELENTAVNVAIAAASWSSAATPESRAAAYKEAGMSAEYATVYKPIWASVFQQTKASEVTASVRNKVELISTKGDEGYRTLKVAVTVDWRASWNYGEGQQFAPAGANPWMLTVDEHTGLVTGVDQPAQDDLSIDLKKP